MDVEEKRLLPDELLDLARREEDFAKQGHLKIFIGMAAGVGKTYAMLKEAHQAKMEGRDPFIGLVLTHGRLETATLMEGLKRIPEKKVNYKGNEFLELDLETILKLRPDLVLIDELAHTNLPGMRHEKRWQDVMEILENGIDVYTTLNVQHIESLNDIVQGIVGVTVRETVPDLLIEKANSIRLVDIAPEELLQRLREGKVYLGDQSKVAITHFFQKDRLTALREIVLRYAAEKVHRDLAELPPITEARIDWKPREKFLAAVSHSPHSQKLIRTARRLSAYLNAPWIALSVDTGKYLTDEEISQLEKNLTLARNLGAEVVNISNPSIVEGIKITARDKGVTQIIIGRPPRSPFSFFMSMPLIDQLATECRDIDIHVIRQDRYNVQFNRGYFSFRPVSKAIEYFYAVASVAVLTALNAVLLPYIGYKAVGSIFLIGILGISLYLKKGPILFASILFAGIWSFFFIPPSGTFSITAKEDLILLAIYVLSALIIGVLIDRTRKYKELLNKSQKNSEALFEVVKAMASSEDPLLVLGFVKKSFSKLLDGSIDIAIKNTSGKGPIDTTLPLLDTQTEKDAFIWTLLNGKDAGFGTDTLPACKNLYLPLLNHNESFGVLIYRPSAEQHLAAEEKKILHTACSQIASFVDRVQTAESTKETEQLEQIEKVHGILIERFSLLFDKPLDKAKKALSALKENNNSLEIAEVEYSLDTIKRTFSNVSAMSQLIEGIIPLEKEKLRLDLIVQECIESLEQTYPNTEIEFFQEDETASMNLDYYLIKILIYNLLIFSIDNSRPGSKLIVKLFTKESALFLTTLSESRESTKEIADRFFERYYTSVDTRASNVGMGLALAKTIAEVHGGSLTVESIDGNGILFTFSISIGHNGRL